MVLLILRPRVYFMPPKRIANPPTHVIMASTKIRFAAAKHKMAHVQRCIEKVWT